MMVDTYAMNSPMNDPYTLLRQAVAFSRGGLWGTEPHCVMYPDYTVSEDMTAEEAVAVARSYNIVNGLVEE